MAGCGRQLARIANSGRVEGGSIDFHGELHVESLMSLLVVELLEKIVELGLLLQTVHACGASGFVFEREMHALMPTVLLRTTGSDAFDGDAPDAATRPRVWRG
jgi:hypothetical protein